MHIPFYRISAFTDNVFGGNPAVVCPLEQWLDTTTMQRIAAENMVPITAFFVKQEGGYRLRWFTPMIEVNLCGHATLAAAHVLYTKLGCTEDRIVFETNSGPVYVMRGTVGGTNTDATADTDADTYVLDFPIDSNKQIEITDAMRLCTGRSPIEAYEGTRSFVFIYQSEEDVANAIPDRDAIMKFAPKAVMISARRQYDYVLRFFGPSAGLDEDPVTGSAHCNLMPYWTKILGNTRLSSVQLSPRGGLMQCELKGDRVLIAGKAVDYSQGQITLSQITQS